MLSIPAFARTRAATPSRVRSSNGCSARCSHEPSTPKGLARCGGFPAHHTPRKFDSNPSVSDNKEVARKRDPSFRVGLWRSWERASMAWKRSSVRSRPGPPKIITVSARITLGIVNVPGRELTATKSAGTTVTRLARRDGLLLACMPENAEVGNARRLEVDFVAADMPGPGYPRWSLTSKKRDRQFDDFLTDTTVAV